MRLSLVQSAVANSVLLPVDEDEALYKCTYRKHKRGLGSYHPFDTEEKLTKVQAALKELTITPVYCNIYVQKDVASLARILNENNAEITLINLSNTVGYDTDFYDINLFSFEGGKPAVYKYIKQYLPISKDALCVFCRLVTGAEMWIGQRDSFWSKIDEGNFNAIKALYKSGRDNLSLLDLLKHCFDSVSSARGSDPMLNIKRLLVSADIYEIVELPIIPINRREVECLFFPGTKDIKDKSELIGRIASPADTACPVSGRSHQGGNTQKLAAATSNGA